MSNAEAAHVLQVIRGELEADYQAEIRTAVSVEARIATQKMFDERLTAIAIALDALWRSP